MAGRTAAAVDVAREGVAWARAAGMVLDEANLLDAWVRFAPSPTLAARLTELTTLSDSPLVELLADHAQALVDADPEALLATAERFAAMTAWWMAAESATAAARLFDARHQARASQAAARAGVGFAGRCEGARTSSAHRVGGPMRLTRRENEIAMLAAGGHSSQEIAGRLMCLSPDGGKPPAPCLRQARSDRPHRARRRPRWGGSQ